MWIGDGTHNKKRNSRYILTFNSKGATPIEKNVIVVDSQGNEYEATYPKRAKGLVKSGRARFVGENKICLACPPNDNLEDKIMENNNINTIETTDNNELTAKDIFVQLTVLQKQLTENSYNSLHHLSDAIDSIGESEEENADRNEQVSAVCDVFRAREMTLQRLLEMYENMYFDMQKETAKKVDMVKAAFDNNMAFINDSDMTTDDKYAALNYVTDKIAELVSEVIKD